MIIKEIAGKASRDYAPDSRSDRGIRDELRQRAASLPPKPAYDTAGITEGKMLLQLLLDRANLFHRFYPEHRPYRKAVDMLKDALHKGLHTGSGIAHWSGFLSPELEGIAAAITRAKGMTKGASGFIPLEEKGISPAASIGSFIDTLDCNALYPLPDQNDIPSQSAYEAAYQHASEKRVQCHAENSWRRVLNEKFEECCHHPLYSFMSSAQADNLSSLAFGKPALHAISMDTLSDLSKIKGHLVREWQTNGIIRQNASNGAGPMVPTDSIDAMYQAQDEGIGGFPIAAVIAVVSAVAAAIRAAKGLIDAIGDENPSAQTFSASPPRAGALPAGPPTKRISKPAGVKTEVEETTTAEEVEARQSSFPRRPGSAWDWWAQGSPWPWPKNDKIFFQ